MAVPSDVLPQERPAGRAFTIHDLLDLPEDGRRYEVLDGALSVSPAPKPYHQFVADRLRRVLEDAAPSGFFVLSATAVRLGEDKSAYVPDVVVTTLDPRTLPEWLEAHDARAVVEVVSRSSQRNDRFFKPHVYASIEIPCYWRVELDPKPTVHIHVLDGDTYRLVQTVEPREPAQVEHPFPMTLDLGDL